MHYTDLEEIESNFDGKNWTSELRELVIGKFEEVNWCIEDFIRYGFVYAVDDNRLRDDIGYFCFKKAKILTDNYQVMCFSESDTVFLSGMRKSLAFKLNGEKKALPDGMYLYLNKSDGCYTIPFSLKNKHGIIASDSSIIIPPILDNCGVCEHLGIGYPCAINGVPFIGKILNEDGLKNVCISPFIIPFNHEELFFCLDYDSYQENHNDQFYMNYKDKKYPFLNRILDLLDLINTIPNVKLFNDEHIINEVMCIATEAIYDEKETQKKDNLLTNMKNKLSKMTSFDLFKL